MNKLRNAFEIIDEIYNDEMAKAAGKETALELKIKEYKTRIYDKQRKFERFFNWENVTFKPFEELDQTNADATMSKAISNSEKISRFKVINNYIENNYHGSSLNYALVNFTNSFAALISDTVSDVAMENFSSEYYPTSIGVLTTTARGLPLLIPDPRKPHNELITHFDRTTMLGLIARNAIRDNFIYDTSCLYKLIAIAALFAVNYDESLQPEDANYEPRPSFEMVFNDRRFFEKHIRPYFKKYEESFIVSSDNKNIKEYKRSLIRSLQNFSQAVATMMVGDFSFFYPFVLTRFIVNSDEEPFILKEFKESAVGLYDEIIAYNNYIINIA